MPTHPKLQLRSLQAGRGFAALLVVALHSSGYFNDDARYWNRPDLFHITKGGQLGVEYFFVLSGTVILLAHWKDLGNPRTIPSYYQKRIRRIYPIYWIILSVVVLEYTLRPGLGATYQTNPWVILSGYLLIHIRSLQVNLPVAWTLFHEILFYVVFSALLYRKWLGYWLLAVWCAMSVVIALYPTNDYLRLYLFAPVHLLFPLGMAVGWLLRERLLKASSLILLLGLLIFGLAYVLYSHASVEPYLVEWLAGIGSALTILGAAGLELNNRLTIPRPLQFLGDASYSIYLVHYPFLMFLTPFLYGMSLRVPVPPTLLLLMMISTGVLVGCLTHLYIERPLLNIWGKTRSTRASPASAR